MSFTDMIVAALLAGSYGLMTYMVGYYLGYRKRERQDGEIKAHLRDAIRQLKGLE